MAQTRGWRPSGRRANGSRPGRRVAAGPVLGDISPGEECPHADHHPLKFPEVTAQLPFFQNIPGYGKLEGGIGHRGREEQLSIFSGTVPDVEVV
ncbi:MAG: hypothetical protein K6T66_14100 [Peptococcaceae bacterium]|nr:hypothetical protein [Peptococcaceae bacterium]